MFGVWWTAALMLAAAQVHAASEAISKSLRLDGGFQEIVVSVPDLEQAVAFYQRVAGWRVVHRGATQPEMLSAWRLPDSAKATEAVLQNPGDPSGFVRLIKFRGIPQEEVRPSARAWDTGGFAGFDLRARDVWQKYIQFRQSGWHGYSQPVQTRLDRNTELEVLMQGSANEMARLSQRLDPPLAGFANLKELSYALNVFAVAKDFDATLAFYTEKLGFKVFLRDQGLAGLPGPNLFGLPHNIVNDVYRRVAFVHPQGDVARDDHAGSLSVTAFYGAQGEDFANRARPPNLGLIAARFPVSDAEARAAELQSKGVALEYEPTDVGMLPYGAVTVFAVRDPNGAWIEFFEPADKPN
jgi:catechol 2,3-dioxygenase-like lactoylglutathione lyase family enzyme